MAIIAIILKYIVYFCSYIGRIVKKNAYVLRLLMIEHY